MKRTAVPPFRGASNNSAFYETGKNGGFAPHTALLNVLRFDQTKDRPRIGTRPGTSEYFTGTFGNGQPIMGCGVTSRGRTVTGLTLGTSTDLTNTNGSTHTQGAVAGNIWVLDQAWGLKLYTYEDVTAAGPYSDTGVNSQPNRSVNAVARNPAGTRIVTGKSYDDGSGNSVARVTCRNATTGAVVWSKKMDDPGINRFVNAIVCTDDWALVFTNHFIRIFRMDTGGNVPNGASSVFGFNSWSSEAIDGCISSSGTMMYALFRGSGAAATLGSGVTVSAGIQGVHFRSGVMKLTIATLAQVQAAASGAVQVLTQAALGTALASSDTYYEANHRYCRFSERLPWAPRGAEPIGIAMMPSNGFAVIHANQAWGPRATAGLGYFPPDGSSGYRTLSVFDSNGNLDWWTDTDSRIDDTDGSGFINDIEDPTLLAIDTDSEGNVYVGGRRTKDVPDADGTSVWSFDRYGDYRWDQDLGQTTTTAVRALKVYAQSMNIAAGGDRNNDWPSASGEANLWELRKDSGGIIRSHDLGASVSVLGIESFSDDTLAFVTDKV